MERVLFQNYWHYMMLHAAATTVKPVFNGTWIKRKPVLNEQILWSREYSTKIHIK
jgi:hypothetical protein